MTKIVIQTKINAVKQAAVISVIQQLESKGSSQSTSADKSNDWKKDSRVRKSPKKPN